MARLVLLGSDPVALPAFEAALGLPSIEVVGVWSQPDRPSGRGQEVRPNAVSIWALARGLPLFRPERFDLAEDACLASLKPDLGLVMAYGQILREPTLAVPRLGFVNLHGSLLPALRGASPVEAALALGWSETGVSLQRVVRALDAGDVLASAPVSITPGQGRASLRAAIGLAAGELTTRALPEVLAGRLAGIPQDPAKVTYCRRLRREDAGLDFHRPARLLADRIRALEGWPGSTCLLGETRLKLGAAVAQPHEEGLPGQILSADTRGVRVATAEGVLLLTQLQRPGGRMLPASDFLSGFPLAAGAILASEAMPELVGSQPLR